MHIFSCNAVITDGNMKGWWKYPIEQRSDENIYKRLDRLE